MSSAKRASRSPSMVAARAAALATAVTLAAVPAVVESQTTRRAAEIRFQAMDRNGDRTISREEWQGSDRSFRVHDWNGDGVLSGNEVRIGARRQDRTAPDYGECEFTDWTVRGFTSIDHNRDGRISRDEWHFDQEAFFRADHNRDGILNRAEFLGESVEDDRDDRFDYLDADNNGRVELDEWHATRAEFNRLDSNNDGRLTRGELGSAEAGNPTESFASLDVNRNGSISFNEWHWSKQSFDGRDLNRDGSLSRSEYTNQGAVGTSGAGARVIRVLATERWTDSGIVVRRGDTIDIEASGVVTLSGSSDDATPAGSRSGRRATESPLPNELAGALLVRIGDAQPAALKSTSATFQAPMSGRLFFGVNDDHLPDNAGQFRVTVRVR
jgi:Ca2+-binding EF-hand superfamily protein